MRIERILEDLETGRAPAPLPPTGRVPAAVPAANRPKPRQGPLTTGPERVVAPGSGPAHDTDRAAPPSPTAVDPDELPDAPPGWAADAAILTAQLTESSSSPGGGLPDAVAVLQGLSEVRFVP